MPENYSFGMGRHQTEAGIFPVKNVLFPMNNCAESVSEDPDEMIGVVGSQGIG
jgi:hypothetical protein